MNTRQSQSAPDLELWRNYIAVHSQLMAHLGRELSRETGLSEADFQVLDALLDMPDARARALQLRCMLQWEKSRLSHQLSRMASRGLIERQVCVEDARGTDIVLTDAGREAALLARRVRSDSLQGLVFETLGPDGMASLADVTSRLGERLAQVVQEDPACRVALAEAFPSEDPDNVVRLFQPISPE